MLLLIAPTLRRFAPRIRRRYDGDQQLASGDGNAVTYTNWNDYPTTDASLSYDSNGNRTSGDSATAAGNRLTFDGTYYYLYDAEGNRVAKFQNSSDVLSGATDITLYTYDNRNRMTSLKHYATYGDEPDMAIAYTYDALDREVDEDETGGADERMIYDGTSVLAVLDASDAVTERYLNPGAPGAVDQVLAVEEVGGSTPGTNWLLADAQGTVRDVVRGTYSDGAMTAAAVDHVFLDAYGDQTTAQSNSDPQEQSPIGFTGLRYDALAGLYDTASRPYDPATGAWLQPDPLGYAAGDSNLYRYVGNDPTNEEDPSGMCSCGSAAAAIAAAAVGADANSGGGTATPVATPYIVNANTRYVKVQAVAWPFGAYKPSQASIEAEFKRDVALANQIFAKADIQVVPMPTVKMITMTQQQALDLKVLNTAANPPSTVFSGISGSLARFVRSQTGAAQNVVIANYVYRIETGNMGVATNIGIEKGYNPNLFYLASTARPGNVPLQSRVLAHELGHVLGLNHDESWKDVDCLMAAPLMSDAPKELIEKWKRVGARSGSVGQQKFYYQLLDHSTRLKPDEIEKLRSRNPSLLQKSAQ